MFNKTFKKKTVQAKQIYMRNTKLTENGKRLQRNDSVHTLPRSEWFTDNSYRTLK